MITRKVMNTNIDSRILSDEKSSYSGNRYSRKSKRNLTRLASYLAWFTIVYNLSEGIVSIWLGIKADAVSLAGFGGDSLIEVGSAVVVLWRLRYEVRGKGGAILEAERKATIVIGTLFILLAAVASVSSILFLYQQKIPESTIPGAVISGFSISFMFFLWRSKLKVARGLNSKALEQDAACSLACIKLSFVLFLGSLLYLVVPSLWWADTIAALVLSYFIFMEGVEAVNSARNPNFQGGCGCS